MQTKLPHHGLALSGFLLLATLYSLAAPAPDYGYPPTITLDEVRELVDQARAPHPRLLTSPAELEAIRRSLDEDPLRRQLADTMIRQADLMLDVAPITRSLQGRRLLGQSRTCVQRVITLSMAFHLTEDPRYARRAEREMLAAARFEDWNPSHFLDVAEMTFALAIGYDWLHDRLDEGARSEIAAAIVQKGVNLPFTTPHHGWVRSSNNWGQVCHGGLTAGALAVLELEPDLAARTVHNAVRNVTHSMAAFAPKGSYPEGPGYWAYGTGYNVLLIGVLESALGADFGLSKAPGFDQTGQYPNLVGGPSGAFFNYADGGAGRGPEPFLFWFADRFDRPDWLLGERDRLRAGLAGMARNPSASGGDRFLPLTLLWSRAAAKPTEIRMPLHWHSEGETPITVHRSSWTDPDATFIGFKGGSPSANHGQMDIGSFVLDADGVRWAMDLGAEGYHGIESRGMNLWNRAQDSDRWMIFRQSNHGHNTLVIDDKLQNSAASGKVVSFSDDREFPHSVIEMSEVYAGQAGSTHRGIALLPSREVLIQDHLTGLQPGSRVRWGMITPGSPGDLDTAQVRLSQGDARLTLIILSPSDAGWRVVNTAGPRNEWDSPNPRTRMLAFEVEAPASGELTLAVLATPGSCAESMRSQLSLRPLIEWGR
jgi:hypothetical protein